MDKPRMTALTADELLEMLGVLDTPPMHKSGGTFYVNADDLRAWRAARQVQPLR